MIIRRKQTANYTALPNIVLTDERISIDARWCLAYLLSKPDNWQVQATNIQEVGGIGRDKAYRLIRELIEAGWIKRSAMRLEDGTFGGYEYVVTDTLSDDAPPSSNDPFPEKPETDKPKSENKHLNKDGKKTSTERVTNTEDYILPGFDLEAEFKEFWAAYPKRPGNPKHKAFVQYVNARKTLRVSKEVILGGVKGYARLCEGKDAQYIKWAVHWLKDRRWQDDYGIAPEHEIDDVNLTELVKLYPGHVGVYPDVQAAVKSQLRIGATLDQICEAAKKYAQYLKELRYDGREIAPPMIETWLKFKWREMDAYEFARVGPDRRLTVRPKRKAK